MTCWSRSFLVATLVGVTASLSGLAQAALFDRGGGLIYDSDSNITWLADANYAETSGYDGDGLMNWFVAKTWAANLVYHDSVRNVDYVDWRLPTGQIEPVNGWCVGYRICGEISVMFYYNFAATADHIILSGTNTANLALFTNLKSDIYWTGTDVTPYPFYNFAWYFDARIGKTDNINEYNEFYAWAVHPGDVAAVPEPETYAMMLAGLGVLGLTARHRRRS